MQVPTTQIASRDFLLVDGSEASLVHESLRTLKFSSNVTHRQLTKVNSNPFISYSSTTTSGISTPPIPMPDAPFGVVDRDLDYASTVQHHKERDWAMQCLISSAGVLMPFDADGHRRHDESDRTVPACTESGIFSFDI
jgi:hypothetical protein